MMLRSLTLPLLMQATLLAAQGSLTLDQARTAALANHPATVDRVLYQQAGELRAGNVERQWLPQVNGAARGTYQSEVTSFDLGGGLPPLITIAKDQYSAGFEVHQNLFDFGVIRDSREMERARATAQAAQADVELMGVVQRVDELYAGILLQKAALRILRVRKEEIAARRLNVASAVRNGVSLASNEEVLRAEELSTEQRIVEGETALMQFTSALAELMGQRLDTSMTFTMPEPPVFNAGGRRPEFHFFEAQRKSISLQADLVRDRNLPRLGAFANGYYGRPGFNFLNNDFRTYGIVGLGLNWNIAGFYTQHREIKVKGLEQKLIDERQRLFEMQQRTDLEREALEIDKLDRMVALDEEIVSSKTLIVKTASSQLEHGVITAQEYIAFQNAQDLAKADLELHRIRAVMARIQHQRTQGF